MEIVQDDFVHNSRLIVLWERKWRTQIMGGRVDAGKISDQQRNANAAAKRKPEWDGEEKPDDLFDLEGFVFWTCSTNHFVTQK